MNSSALLQKAQERYPNGTLFLSLRNNRLIKSDGNPEWDDSKQTIFVADHVVYTTSGEFGEPLDTWAHRYKKIED